jgi:hypothetical protein
MLKGSALARENKPLLNIGLWGSTLLALLAIAFALAWVSSGFQQVQGWLSFLGVLVIAAALLFGGWHLLQAGEGSKLPGWLAGVLIGAALLRLAAGVLWYVELPIAGHGSPQELAGYIMADAHERDLAAWDLGHSNKSLLKAFQGSYRKADQYGGLLFLSAAIYRILGGDTHYPLLMVVLTAAFSALALIFTWALSRRVWGERAALFAAWGLALYPEAVLLGSSQMREAFTVTLTVAAFYGLIRYAQDHSWFSLAWILVPLLLYLPFSPPFAALLGGMLALTAFALRDRLFQGKLLHSRRLWLVLAGLAILILAGLWVTLGQSAPDKISNPLALIGWWARKSGEFQAYLSKRASGMVQKVFRSTPAWTHIYFLVAYGVLRPFLPAALIISSDAPIHTWITLWRAIGWTILLVLLVYALLKAFSKENRGFISVFSLVVWLGILIASYRGGGDMWDNPRYRAAFAGLQVALAAWAWTAPRRATDPLLRRAFASMGLALIWFIPWYMRREFHTPWPVSDLFKTIGLGLASAILFLIWDWARTNGKRLRENLHEP